MKVLVKHPFDDSEEKEIDNTDEALCELIGGQFDEVRLFADAVLLERRAPLMHRLLHNAKICGRSFYGTVVAVGMKDGERIDFPVPLAAWRICLGKERRSGT